jgi:peroxiredoxin
MPGVLRKREKRRVLFTVVAIFLLCGSAWALQDAWKEMYVLQLNGVREAYNFSLTDMNGTSRELAEFRGKVVLLVFWATFCPPCIEEMPALNRLQTKFQDQGLVVLGVSMDDGKDRVAAYLQSVKIDFPILWDEDLEVGKQYRVYALPMTYIIDRRGYLIGVAMGARAWDSPAAHTLVASVLEAS